MSTNTFVLSLNEHDLLELQAVLMDKDKDAALRFLEVRIAPRLPKKGTSLCDSSRLNPYLLQPDTPE
jgi:hypothetical protein